jgi:hypothetical protein
VSRMVSTARRRRTDAAVRCWDCGWWIMSDRVSIHDDDDVSIDELREAVEHMHGVPARFVEAVEVDERFKGEIVWQGAVKVFALIGHPSGAKLAYAWSYRTEGKRRKFKAVLGVPPVDGPVMGV